MAATVKLSITARSISGDVVTTNISNVNPALFASTDAAVLMASYEFIDNAARKLNALTTNTYVDSVISRDISVNEELAD